LRIFSIIADFLHFSYFPSSCERFEHTNRFLRVDLLFRSGFRFSVRHHCEKLWVGKGC
jgi:hypothetical protein